MLQVKNNKILLFIAIKKVIKKKFAKLTTLAPLLPLPILQAKINYLYIKARFKALLSLKAILFPLVYIIAVFFQKFGQLKIGIKSKKLYTVKINYKKRPIISKNNCKKQIFNYIYKIINKRLICKKYSL